VRSAAFRGKRFARNGQVIGKSDAEVGLPSDNQGETVFSSGLSRDICYWQGGVF
jgi:hypothetical protein